MTTPSEEEARAAAEKRWPQEWFYTEGFADPNFTPRRIPVGDGRRTGFVEGAIWAASRVSTPPADELERLRAWKAEAIDVLNRWEQVWEAAGRPGRLGRSKADSVREWIEARALSTPPSEQGSRTAENIAPGLWLDSWGNVWRMWRDGIFSMLGTPGHDPKQYEPFTPLIPVVPFPPTEPGACDHSAWEVIGGAGQCADCREYLGAVPVLPTEPAEDSEWVTAPDGEGFRRGACQGHACCTAKVHEHGCFADHDGTRCDHPEEHPAALTEPEEKP